jgi:hypothetical protein
LEGEVAPKENFFFGFCGVCGIGGIFPTGVPDGDPQGDTQGDPKGVVFVFVILSPKAIFQ